MYPLAPYSCVVFSHSLTLSLSLLLASSEAWLALLLSYQKNAATANFNGAEEEEKAKKGFLFKKLSYNSDALLYWHRYSIESYIIHFKMFCTNSWRKKVYTPLHSQSIKLYFVLKSICGMQLADASMYCAVCGGGSTLKNAIRLLYLSKIPIW